MFKVITEKRKMVRISVSVLDNTKLDKKMKDIIKGAKRGVRLATEAGVQWIHQDVFSGQGYVGSANYPDVTPVTKMIKAKAGKQLVGIWTGATMSSFRSAVSGLSGKITGSVYEYFGSKWHIDALFMEHRKEKTEKIIEAEIKKKLK